MGFVEKIKITFRGDVPLAALPREALRRYRAKRLLREERRSVDDIDRRPARLVPGLHESQPVRRFWPDNVGHDLTSEQIAEIRAVADAIVTDSTWDLLGFGPLKFEGDFWHRDPLNGTDWGLDFHDDVKLDRDDRDVRILWELNRFGHVIPLAVIFAITKEDAYAETFFAHVEMWMEQNPYGRGANWACAMEAALRAVNIGAAFDLCRHSTSLTKERTDLILRFFDQHGRFIVDNSEFSFISTSNHYFANVVGLFWIGALFPELAEAVKWRSMGWTGLLAEIEKQFLPDGANFEASTGYHKFVTEMVLYSFILAERTGMDIDKANRELLARMLGYLRQILRPDQHMPLIGDADGSRILPLIPRNADDAAYLLDLGAVFLNDERLKLDHGDPEVACLFGEDGISLPDVDPQALSSAAFPDAGSYKLRDRDLYLHFNANDCGLNGRGSHAHNDALSIEVAAFGRVFITDPGSYVYNLDRSERHRFRSTAFHSTLMIDGQEQNTTNIHTPFKLGNEARPQVLEWRTDNAGDVVSAEHCGYERLRSPVVHRRTIEFDKSAGYWTMTDNLLGNSEHDVSFYFHIASKIELEQIDNVTFCLSDKEDRRLVIHRLGLAAPATVNDGAVSLNYGHRERSLILSWSSAETLPLTVKFDLIPVAPGADLDLRLAEIARLTDNKT